MERERRGSGEAAERGRGERHPGASIRPSGRRGGFAQQLPLPSPPVCSRPLCVCAARGMARDGGDAAGGAHPARRRPSPWHRGASCAASRPQPWTGTSASPTLARRSSASSRPPSPTRRPPRCSPSSPPTTAAAPATAAARTSTRRLRSSASPSPPTARSTTGRASSRRWRSSTPGGTGAFPEPSRSLPAGSGGCARPRDCRTGRQDAGAGLPPLGRTARPGHVRSTRPRHAP